MSFRGNLIRRGINCTFSEVIVGVLFCKHQAAPVAMTTADTITTAGILGGIITATHTVGATAAYTLPTGADLDAALTRDFTVNSSFEFTIINLSVAAADTITLTASVGITIVGQPIVEAALTLNCGTFRVRKTAADTFVAYRL